MNKAERLYDRNSCLTILQIWSEIVGQICLYVHVSAQLSYWLLSSKQTSSSSNMTVDFKTILKAKGFLHSLWPCLSQKYDHKHSSAQKHALEKNNCWKNNWRKTITQGSLSLSGINPLKSITFLYNIYNLHRRRLYEKAKQSRAECISTTMPGNKVNEHFKSVIPGGQVLRWEDRVSM